MRLTRVVIAAALGLVASLSTPTRAQEIGDLVGSWASSDEMGHWGNGDRFIELPSCNDVWQVTQSGGRIAQGRASLRILVDNGSWYIADQEPNSSFFESDWAEEIPAEALIVDGTDPANFTIGWGGERKPAKLSKPDPNLTVLQIDNRFYSRCLTLPGQPVDAEWTPPAQTVESYHRCWFVNDLSMRMASSANMIDEAQYARSVASEWSEATAELGSAFEDFGGNSIADQVQAMWSGAGSEEAQQTLFFNEYFRCNGPPPTELE
jgi:hypothetical protein